MPTILVVDDNPSVRALLTVALSELGTVITAPDGPTAIQFTDGEVPDVAILDVMMPYVSGIDVLQAWRNDPRTQQMPVVVLSARDQMVNRCEGYEAGADAYVAKPFDVELMLTLVRSLMVELDEDATGILAELRALAGVL